MLSARLVVELVPVPDRATVSGLPGALLLTDRVPVADPAAVGANVTPTVQVAPAASDVPQLFDSPNGPVTPIDAIDAAADPLLLMVTVLAALVEPTFSLPNDSLDGEAVSVAVPEPPPPDPGKISNSEIWAASQPVLPVTFSS